MGNLTRMSITPTQAILLEVLVGMLSLCTACTKLSQTERIFYGRGNPAGPTIGFVVMRSVNAIVNAAEFINDFDTVSSGGSHDYLTYYENGKPMGRIKINGIGLWVGTWFKESLRGLANGLGDIVSLGAISYDDSLIFNISDQQTGGREELLDYLGEQRRLAERLREGRNPVSGDPLRVELFDKNGKPSGQYKDLDTRTRDQKLTDAMQQRRLESIFFRSFDPKYYEEHIDEVEEAYRQIAGNGMSRRSAGFYTNGLELSRDGLDVGFADLVASNLREPGDKFEVGGGLYMKDGTMMKPAAPFNPADVDVARFRALVQYEQKRHADKMAKIAANVADWDNFIKNAPNSVRNALRALPLEPASTENVEKK